MQKKPQQKSPLKNRERSVSLYIHFPYCLYKCHYCDFNSYAISPQSDLFEEMADAIVSELNLRKELYEREGQHFFEKGLELRSLFFGGGTPSLMSAKQVEKILEAVGAFFHFSPRTEITLEANPKTIDGAKLKDFKRAGINRISVGIQSLQDDFLATFGRIHSAKDGRQALKAIPQAGFENWNADLMFGFPGQSFEQWRQTVEGVLEFNPPHLSCYAFTVEEGSPYGHHVKEKKASPPDEDLQAEIFQWNFEFLSKKNLKPYELSNFSKAGVPSSHNLTYWNYEEFVGLGPGAVSFLHSSGPDFGYRTTNSKAPKAYLRGIKEAKTWFGREEIKPSVARGEFMMMGLRLMEGIDEGRFQRYFGSPWREIFGKEVEELRAQGLLHPHQLALTHEGLLLSNQVMGRFFID